MPPPSSESGGRFAASQPGSFYAPMMRSVLVVCLLVLLAACGSAAHEPAAKSKPATFFVTGTLHIDQVMNVHIDHGACTVEGLDSPNVVVTDPAGKKVAKVPLGAGKAEALPGAEYYTPGICEFPFELTALPKASGVFQVQVDGGDASATFTDTDRTVRIDWTAQP